MYCLFWITVLIRKEQYRTAWSWNWLAKNSCFWFAYNAFFWLTNNAFFRVLVLSFRYCKEGMQWFWSTKFISLLKYFWVFFVKLWMSLKICNCYNYGYQKFRKNSTRHTCTVIKQWIWLKILNNYRSMFRSKHLFILLYEIYEMLMLLMTIDQAVLWKWLTVLT